MTNYGYLTYETYFLCSFFLYALALLAEQFLESSASQLTYHGLCELNSVMADNELAVIFRNNHFSTIFKRRVCIINFCLSICDCQEEMHVLSSYYSFFHSF